MASNPLKRYDTYKDCVIETSERNYEEVFTSDWSFTDIKDWMIDTYSIDVSSIRRIVFSSISVYKNIKS